jgi:branched-subunit amino acid aminotransferase/4-amino-4-deoxychorismate lyase
VIDLARELGVGVRERRVTPEDLRRHPVFVVNAVRGVGPVVSLGGEAVPDAGLIGMLARAFWPSG